MQYEIEIKSLLGSQNATDAFLKKVQKLDPSCQLVNEQKQLNHYFKGGAIPKLVAEFVSELTDEQVAMLKTIAERATSVNVRSRQKNNTTLLIVKGSLDATSAAHSHQRMEFEAPLALSIDVLDQRIERAGWQLEAKWQAERKMYEAFGLTLDIFFSPGYGYLVEFEKVVDSESERKSAYRQVIATMEQLGVAELANDRLERMFAYYNEHWREYYGTRNIFTVE